MRKLSKLLLLMLCASVFFISCKEEKFAPARLLVANASITQPISPNPLPTVGSPFEVFWGGDLAFNNVVYGAAGVTSGTPVTTINAGQVIAANYATVKSGAFPLNFTVSSGAPIAPSTGTTLYNRITSFLPGRNYTAVAFDVSPFYKVLVTEDDLSAPPAGKAKIRFVHAIPQALINPALLSFRRDTIDVTASPVSNPVANTAIFTNRRFADNYTNPINNQFSVIDTGTYVIRIRINNSTGLVSGNNLTGGLLGGFPGIRFAEGKIYTIIGRVHIPTITTTPIGATFITHN